MNGELVHVANIPGVGQLGIPTVVARYVYEWIYIH